MYVPQPTHYNSIASQTHTVLVFVGVWSAPVLSADVVVVYALVGLALLLFVTEPIPIDLTAIVILVALVVLEPWTAIGAAEAIGGFANPATVTVLAMFVLSEGIRRTGAIRLLADRVVPMTGGDERRQLAAVVGLSGGFAGVINNTPVVAVLMPFVTDMAERTGTNASQLLIPLSYGAMLGGMLTLIGTAPNILASDISDRLIGQPYSMFTFTQLGAVVLLVGFLYMMTVGHRLLPEREDPDSGLSATLAVHEYVAELRVPSDAAIVGTTVSEAFERFGPDVELVRIHRRGKVIARDLDQRRLLAGDYLLVRATRGAILELTSFRGLELATPSTVHRDVDTPRRLATVIVVPEVATEAESLTVATFRRRFDAEIHAIRRQGELIRGRLSSLRLRNGDMLLIEGTDETFAALLEDVNFVVAEEVTEPTYRVGHIPIAIAIVAGVVLVAALELLPVVVAALAGMVAMAVTGCVEPAEMYDAIDWNVIFLLAGVIPLGVALERTGGAALIAHQLVPLADVLSPLAFLVVFYLVTAVITELVTNLASVALMAPIGVDVAVQIGADPFSFMLLVTFAASNALMTPVGYQTNLMVYGRGGYRFTDFMRIGIPLQLVLGVVTPLGIVAFWGI